MNNLKTLISAYAVAVALSACGGGSDSGGSPEAAGTGGIPGASGVVTGSISSIVGSYSVKVVKVDCTPFDDNGTSAVPQADGSCKITTPLFTRIERNMLPAGAYTLKITADGAIEMLQGTASKVKISCPPSPGTCRVDPNGTSGYSYIIGSSSVGSTATTAESSALVFDVAGTKVSFRGGILATLNTNASFTITNPLSSGETGILEIRPN